MEPWLNAPWTPRQWQRAALPKAIDAVKRKKRGIVSAVMGGGKSILCTELAVLALQRAHGTNTTTVLGVPTQALVRQLAETVRARCGAEQVGEFYADKKQPGRPVVVACYDSIPNLVVQLAARNRRCGLLIGDEVHQTEAETVLASIEALRPTGQIGFSATPFRSVPSEVLSVWDEVVYTYTMADALRDKVLVPWRTINWSGDGESDALDDVCLRLIAQHARGPGVTSALTIPDAEAFAARAAEAGFEAKAIHSKLKDGDERIAWLEEADPQGPPRMLVHINMLAEGVDFPWLRWLCLRRPVGARVRFVQEFGRPLRAHPGKDHAIVIDPHDLLGTHGIAHAPAVGVAGDEVEGFDPNAPERNGNGGRPGPVVLPRPKAIAEATQWARALLLSLQAAGLAASDTVSGNFWRTRRPSDQQLRALSRLAWASRYVPADSRAVVKALVEPAVAEQLQRGAVSDLLSVLSAVADASADARKRQRHWPWPDGLVLPAIAAGALPALRPSEAV